jgi:hypothetical protein
MSWWKTIAVSAAFLAFASLAVSALPGAETVTFTVVGRVQFTVPADWVVIASKSDAANTLFAFQIKNPADEHTSDSTNLALTAYDLKNADSKIAFEKRDSNRDPKSQKMELEENWTCTGFSAVQKSTKYDARDCSRIVSDCGVLVRIAWPHLPKNSPDYDKLMETALIDLLRSVAPSPK